MEHMLILLYIYLQAATPSYDPFQMSSDPNVPISKE